MTAIAPAQAPGLLLNCLNVSSTRDTVSDSGGFGAGPDEDQDSNGDDPRTPSGDVHSVTNDVGTESRLPARLQVGLITR